MIERDFKARYIGSMFGLFWSIIQPLMLVLIYSFIFSFVFGRKIGNVPFSLWLFCALIPWLMFSEIIKNSSGLLTKNKNLITKTPFHPEILPLVTIGAAATSHIIAFCILLMLLLFFNVKLGIYLLTLPVYFFCLALFSLGLSWLLSSLNVFIKDIGQIINLILQLWFYLCPIIYPSSIIPENYMVLMRLNPIFFITEGYRRALLKNQGVVFIDLLYFLAITFIFLFIGAWVFRRLKDQFAEVL